MRYFTGTLKGTVKAATATTWKDLVDRYIGVPIPLNITREQYFALDPREQAAAKSTSYLTPAAFAKSPSPRKREEATWCNLLFIDVDASKNGGPHPAAALLKNLDILADQLSPWNYVVHHTVSSTPEAPRLRVMVEADQIPLERYQEAVRTVARCLGMPSITLESTVAVQPMYLPCLFAGVDEDEHPLVIQEIGGRAFTVADIGDTGSVGTESRKRGVAHSADGSIDILDFLRAPVDGIAIAEAEEMLEAIDPDCAYYEWVEAATALKHQFQGDQEEEAYALFDKWSSKGSKYGGEDETKAKWDSFKPTPLGRVPVTIRSLMHRAAMAGWSGGKVKETQLLGTLAWLKEQTNISTLLSEGIARIVATPLTSQAEEDGLLHQLVAAAKKLGLQVSLTSLRRDLRAAKEKTRDKDHGKTSLPSWVKGVCYISATEELFRHRTGERMSLTSWDNTYGKRLLPTEKQILEQGLMPSEVTMSKPLILPRHYALNVVKVPTVWDYIYDPGSPNDIFVINGGKSYVNTYRRCHPQPDPDRADEAGALILGHMRVLIREEDYQRRLLDWLAYHVQFPGRKIRWSPLIQGAEGCGKTFLSDMMSAILGAEHVQNIGGESLFGNTNEWATGKQLVTLEEVRVVGHSKHETMNKIKPLVTNDRITIAQKFRDVRQVANCTNYMLLTNHKDSLAITDQSRRYMVIESALQAKDQVTALRDAGHFNALYEMLMDNKEGVRAWFENYEISPDFNPDGAAPDTVYLRNLVDNTASDAVSAVRRIIKEGDNPLVQADILSSKTLLDMLVVNEGLNRVSSQYLSSILRDEGYTQLGRHLIGEERHYVWVHHQAPRNRDYAADLNYRLANDMTNLDADMLF